MSPESFCYTGRANANTFVKMTNGNDILEPSAAAQASSRCTRHIASQAVDICLSTY